jgi:acyl-CoA reductase-like NAD-dependent aldehyde dehydrogenase
MDDLRTMTASAPPRQSLAILDQAVARVHAAAEKFTGLPLDARIALAEEMQRGYLAIAEESVRAGCRAKGIDYDSMLSAEEWSTGPWCVVRHLRLVREQLAALRRSGNTTIGKIHQAADGRTMVQVFPGNRIDGMLFQGCSVDVRMQHGEDASSVEQRRAGFYRGAGGKSRVVLVLGAGNIAAIGPMDVITMMFNHGKVCVLKMNPVNAYLGPYIERAFASAIHQGFLAVVYGGMEEGDYLVKHAGIDEIHLTGSDATHDAIVWGPPGPDRELRKQMGTPLCTKPVTSELGNVSPVILVPGPYTERELAYQAEELASYATMNASFLCNAARVLITPQQWAPRRQFLTHLQQVLRGISPRKSYYPGAMELWQRQTENRKHMLRMGEADGESLPWTLVSDMDAQNRHEPLFERESFCPILMETPLGSSDPVEFLEQAVDFANDRLWGTLSATLVVHPQLMKDKRTAAAVERAIVRLRYGTVAINAYPGMSFALGSPPWGAYPGATLDNIQSGRGWVHNTSMLEGIEKTVMRFPLTMFPKPAYMPSNRNGANTMQALVRLDADARWSRLPSVMWNAMHG